MTSIGIIAGETSGDQLGGWLLSALRKKLPNARFIGIGGVNMEAQGLKSLFPLHELSLIGVFEILPHVFSIKKRMRETIEFFAQEKPDVLITIDSPGFTLRVVKALRERGLKTKFIHYVAPTVWSHRPERAATTAALVDSLLVILPFEAQYFWNEGLDTHYIGHEIAWYWREKGDGAAFRKKHNIAPNAPLLVLLPASRSSELKRHLPVFRETVAKLATQVPGLETVMQLPPHLMEAARKATHDWPVKLQLIDNLENKKDLFAASTAALTKSGTACLECALAGLPNVTIYRAHPISAWVVGRMLTVPFVNMPNILLGREVVPEFIQEDFTADKITSGLLPLLTNETERKTQTTAFANIARMLGANETVSPSDKAAEIIATRI